jgi:protein O-mannosyl-transferase
VKFYLALALFAIVVICFAPVCQCGFVYLDDDSYVFNNPWITGGISWENAAWAWDDSTEVYGFWVPLTFWSLQLDACLFGPTAAWGFHLTNLLLHACNVVLFFVLFARMTNALWTSAIAAILWGIHPLRVESVAWVTERKDVLSGFFFLLTMLAYFWYTKRPSVMRYSLIFLAYLLGLMAKPVIVTLPFCLLLLDYWPLGRLRFSRKDSGSALSTPGIPWGRLVLEKLPLLAIAMAIAVETMHYSEAMAIMWNRSWGDRVCIALSHILGYLEKTVWPADLAAFYPLEVPSWERTATAITVLTVITIFVVLLCRREPALMVGWFWFLGALVPNSGIVQAGWQGMADRFTYLAHLGLAVAVAFGMAHFARERPRYLLASKLLLVVLLTTLGTLTWTQVWHWQNTVTLFGHALGITGDTYQAHRGLAMHYCKTGDFDRAAYHCTKALAQQPGDTNVSLVYGEALFRTGMHEKAALTLMKTSPFYAGTIRNYFLGAAFVELGRWQSAKGALELTLQSWPAESQGRHPGIDQAILQKRIAATYVLLGEIAVREGDLHGALKHLDDGLHLDSDQPAAHHWSGVAWSRLGDWTRAKESFLAAAKLNPADQLSCGYLAWVCARQLGETAAASEYAEVRAAFPAWQPHCQTAALKFVTSKRFIDHARASELATQLCEATQFKDTTCLETLAAVQAATGDFEKAQLTARSAMAFTNDPVVKRKITENLKLFEARKSLPVIVVPP